MYNVLLLYYFTLVWSAPIKYDYNLNGIICSSFCSNPDQSKHLETATMFVFDTFVDFVNLRSEKYTSSSRIPTVVSNLASLAHSFYWLSMHTAHTYLNYLYH